MSSELFRQEALAAKQDQHGMALGIRPVSAPRLTAFFAALAAAVLLLLVLGSYTKKERVGGVVQAQQGVALIVLPPGQQGGVIKRVLVTEGQRVQAGDVIAEVSQERFSDEGSTDALLEQNLQAQHRRLQSQAEGQLQMGAASRSVLEERIRHARHDLETLNEEIRLQEQQIATSRRMVDQLQPLLADRVISELQFEQQRAQLLDQQARLQTLKRQRTAAETDAAQAGEEMRRMAGQAQVDRAGLDRDLLSLQQEQVQRRAQRVTLIKSPTAGVISGLTATPGQALGANALLASVVPEHSPLEATLYVPSTAVGFIKPGQGVRISYDAFPYQRFGQHHGTVRSVSQTDVPLPAASGDGNKDRRAVFLVKVALDKDSVSAYGREIRLHPGLTLSADIELDRRRLIRWMLDPLFAFSGQL
ncbi:hypothetical protein JY96_11625 [Aquabacterium sp. NJ1]|uniref:HlyD family secretion protein n=1 Tax=Aquabacterium sp. NJ1 TaxID=1538295 RepID=UPI00052D9009|nr:HlyD family efflux transporter periplasmic adaptor subunit [Aquabacterium sp. NJ1]KGM40472.1 hypothetical protein JY96_11625 [Aquabacterium sp. NJ1]